MLPVPHPVPVRPGRRAGRGRHRVHGPRAAKGKGKEGREGRGRSATIEEYQAKDGWRFRIKNADGKSVAIGTVGYEKKEECLKVVDFVKATMAKAKVTEIKEEKK